MNRPWPYMFNKTSAPEEMWQSQNIAQTQRNQQQLKKQQRRHQSKLATEIEELENPKNGADIKNSENNNFFNTISTSQLQQQAQKPSYYNYNTNRGVPQSSKQTPSLPPNNRFAPSTSTTTTSNSSTEQFNITNSSQRSARTFTFISDFLANLFPSCVDPCTIDAYNQNRCCVTLATAPSSLCCQYGLMRPPQPIQPPLLVRPSIGCCTTCSYGFYGPPPCTYYGSGVSGYYGGGGGFPIGNGGGLYLGGGLGNLAYGGLGISLRPLG